MKLPVLLIALGLLVGCAQQAAQEPPPPPPKPPLELLGQWGKHGAGPGELCAPISLAADKVGNVYVGTGSCRTGPVAPEKPLSGFVEPAIHKFNPEGKPLLAFAFGQEGGGACSIALGGDGIIYAAECRWDAVHMFAPDGSYLRSVRRSGKQWLGAPEGIAVDGFGEMFVSERRSHRVSHIDGRGRLLKRWGRRGTGTGEFDMPCRVALGPDGFVYVADVQNRRIQKFTHDGEFVLAWSFGFSERTPFFRGNAIYGLAVSDRFVAVSDSGSEYGGKPALHVFTLDGQLKYAESFTDWPGPGKSAIPLDVAFNSKGELFVLDGVGPRVLRFRINF